LWANLNIQDAFEKRGELGIQIPCTSNYFFDHVERFAQENFVASPDDIFRAKIKTTGISEVVFELNHVEFTIVDVGGQRSERKKMVILF